MFASFQKKNCEVWIIIHDFIELLLSEHTGKTCIKKLIKIKMIMLAKWY